MRGQPAATLAAGLAGRFPQPQAAGQDKADIGRDSMIARCDGSQAYAGGQGGRDHDDGDRQRPRATPERVSGSPAAEPQEAVGRDQGQKDGSDQYVPAQHGQSSSYPRERRRLSPPTTWFQLIRDLSRRNPSSAHRLVTFW